MTRLSLRSPFERGGRWKELLIRSSKVYSTQLHFRSGRSLCSPLLLALCSISIRSNQPRRINHTKPYRHSPLIAFPPLSPQQMPNRLIHQHVRAPILSPPKQHDPIHAQLTNDFTPHPPLLPRFNHDRLDPLGRLNKVHQNEPFPPLEPLPILRFERRQERGDILSVDVVPSAFSLRLEDESLGLGEGEGEGREACGGGVERVESGETVEELGGVGEIESGEWGRGEVGSRRSFVEEGVELAGGREDLLHFLAAGELEGKGRAFDGG